MAWECHQCGTQHDALPERCSGCGTAPEIVRNVWRCSHCAAEGNPATISACQRCGAERALGAETAVAVDQRIEGRLGRQLAGGPWRFCAYCDVQVAPVDEHGAPIEHCPTCAGPLQEATLAAGAELVSAADAATYRPEATRRLDAPEALEQPHRPARSSRRPASRRTLKLLLAVGLVAIGVVLALSLAKREASFVVASRSWERRIEIERLGPVQRSAWRSQLPAGARISACSRQIHHHDRVPDGVETYQVREPAGRRCTAHGYVKQGGVSVRQCTRWETSYRDVTRQRTRYRSVPVFGEHCGYSVDEWHTVRAFVAEGGGVETPTWPEIAGLAGQERAGKRTETYQLVLQDQDGKPRSYPCDAATWQRYPPNSRVQALTSLGGKIKRLLPPD